MLQSRLVTPRQNQGAELWLVNPSKSDREVHEAGYETLSPPKQPAPRSSSVPRPLGSDAPRRGSVPGGSGLFGAAFSGGAYPPVSQFPSSPVSTTTPKQTLMMGLSNLTNFTRKAAKEVLNHPLAKEVVPHLPPSVRSMVDQPGEGIGPGRRGLAGKAGTNDIASEFESARLYLARWARVVAEEGEKSRRQEVARRAILTGDTGMEDLAGSLGVFSLLSPGSKKPVPSPTRQPDEPISSRDWDSFAAQGRDELFIRREIFRRGFVSSEEPEERRARKEGWEVLLDIVKWDVGDGVLGNRKAEREKARTRKREEYEQLKKKWRDQVDKPGNESWREEWHRIDVDCRRTDRNQGIFAVPDEARGAEEKEGGGSGKSSKSMDWEGKGEDEEGGMAKLNRELAERSTIKAYCELIYLAHIAALRTVLMTYHTYSPELGYVQGELMFQIDDVT